MANNSYLIAGYLVSAWRKASLKYETGSRLSLCSSIRITEIADLEASVLR